jgi:hypothetical protein
VKIDKIKETLNTLRVALSIISAIIITLGGTLGSLYRHGDIDIIFWISSVLFFGFLLGSFSVVHKIKTETNKIGEL